MSARAPTFALLVGVVILAMLAADACRAQAQPDTSDIGRLRHDHQQRIDDRMRFFTVVSYERYVPSDDVLGTWPQLSLRGGITYNAKEWLRLEAGVGTYYTWRDNTDDLFELRLWQAATFDWPEVHARTRWVAHHRFMLEERFQHADGWDTKLRGRYRLSFTIPVNTYTVEPGGFYLPLEGELYWNPGSSEAELFANKATVTAGLGLQFNESWAAELRYVWQESRDTVGADFDRDDNIVELRIKSTIRILDYLKSR